MFMSPVMSSRASLLRWSGCLPVSRMSRNVFPLLLAVFIFLLSACQSTALRVSDCKKGDWGIIGNQDGDQGLTPRFEERQKFCSGVEGGKFGADSSRLYLAGWEQGNFQYWRRLGSQDGLAARAMSSFADQAVSEAVKKNNTPLHQLAYKQGWISGNAAYWHRIGDEDGAAGQPASSENVRASEGVGIGFNRFSYLEGWRHGNAAYWTRLGYLDAHAGIPDGKFRQHAELAQRAGVQVVEAAYRSAWDLEIIEYWKKLAGEDATTGRDVNTRRVDAQERGLKFTELEYKRSWEQRLIQYWQEAGKLDGDGKPSQLESRMANARNNKVFVIAQTREVYQQAWAAQNALYCSAENAFAYGRRNQSMAVDVCAGAQQSVVRQALMSGQEYAHIVRQQSYRNDELRRLAERRNEALFRLNRLDQEMRNDARRDQDEKTRISAPDAAAIERRREQERRELRDFLRRSADEFEDLQRIIVRYDYQLRQIRRDIRLDDESPVN